MMNIYNRINLASFKLYSVLSVVLTVLWSECTENWFSPLKYQLKFWEFCV